jgi:hypothetical protein
MKTIIASVAMLLSTSVFAGPFAVTQDPNQYDGYAGSKTFPTAIQPGIGDNYGSSFLFKSGFIKGEYMNKHGNNDAYGSSLLDLGHAIDW